MSKHNGKCEECGRTLRTKIEQFIGPAKSRPITPGQIMPGCHATCIKQLSGTDWCADFRIGLWIDLDDRRVCSDCADRLDPPAPPAPAAPPRYAFHPDMAGTGATILTLAHVKAWRQAESDAGRPAALLDFFQAHNICPHCKGNQRTIVKWYGNRPVVGNCPACKATGLWTTPAEFVCEWQGGGKASVPCIVLSDRAAHIENYPVHKPGTTTAEYVLINGHRIEACPKHLREIYAPAEQAEMFFYGDYFPARKNSPAAV